MSTEDTVARTSAAGFDRHRTKAVDPAEPDRVAWTFLREHDTGNS